MNRYVIALSSPIAFALAFAALPAAAAPCAGDLAAPHISRMGTHATPAAGNGTVRVQVQINPDGSHEVTRIISSTNARDDQAAREMAQSSQYRPATCSGRAVVWFYDPLFHFSGGSVSTGEVVGGGGSIESRVEQLIRLGQYDNAKTLAQSGLQSDPSNERVQQLLGVAEYFQHDYDDAAAAFAHGGTIEHSYAAVAADAYAHAAVHVSQTDPQAALEYGQRAVALDHGANSHFALGVAEVGNKQYATAISTLQSVHATIFNDSHASPEQRYDVDQYLMQAYIGNGDTADAQALVAEMHRLNPSNPYGAQAIGMIYINQGNAARDAKNYTQALALFDRAAALGDTKVELAAYEAADITLIQETPPDTARIKAYADKALAIDANDPYGNFFEGYYYAQDYGKSHNQNSKAQALTYLDKADTLAKAAGIQFLATQAEKLKTQLTAQAPPSDDE